MWGASVDAKYRRQPYTSRGKERERERERERKKGVYKGDRQKNTYENGRHLREDEYFSSLSEKLLEELVEENHLAATRYDFFSGVMFALHHLLRDEVRMVAHLAELHSDVDHGNMLGGTGGRSSFEDVRVVLAVVK